MKTGIVIVLLLILVLVVTIFILQQIKNNLNNQEEIDQTIPDSAIGFGSKFWWFAIKTSEKEKLTELLKIKNISKCNWNAGLNKAYKGSVFITPTIDEWTLACGFGLPSGDYKESIAEVKELLQTLSKEFGEAQFFCTHRVIEYHSWLKANNGQVTRVYSYIGERGENIAVEGEPTQFEKQFKLINTFSEEAKEEKYFENINLLIPDEEFVMSVAENWSINPYKLNERKDLPLTLGLIGQR